MKLLLGDCLDKLKELDDNSVDSIITDPPYGLSFMGKKWDYDVPSQEIFEECLRVLKPGGHLLSFAGSRTYHRIASAIEDAGFEIRDQIMWIYGSGFPKSHNIGKAYDKKMGNEREVFDHKWKGRKINGSGHLEGQEVFGKYAPQLTDTKGTSSYEGWGTALKPAHEPIVLARKPFKGTVVDNVIEHGTGGINIDESRISTDEVISNHSRSAESAISKGKYGDSKEQETHQTQGQTLGRFPANIIFDEEAGKILDEQGDTGGASRFFYCPKTSKKDRNDGVDRNPHPTVKPTDLMLYLIRLVTPKGGTTLDPFMGSGSTGKAAVRGGFEFVGIEREEEYMNIAEARIQYEIDNPFDEQKNKRFKINKSSTNFW